MNEGWRAVVRGSLSHIEFVFLCSKARQAGRHARPNNVTKCLDIVFIHHPHAHTCLTFSSWSFLLPSRACDNRQVLILKGPDKGRTAIIVGIINSRNQAVVRVDGVLTREMRVVELTDIARQLPDDPKMAAAAAAGAASLASKK